MLHWVLARPQVAGLKGRHGGLKEMLRHFLAVHVPSDRAHLLGVERRSHAPGDIRLHPAVPEEQLLDSRVPLDGGNVERCVALVVGQVHIGTVHCKQLAHVEVSGPCDHVERGLAEGGVLDIRGATMLEKDPRQVVMTLATRDMQRSLALPSRK